MHVDEKIPEFPFIHGLKDPKILEPALKCLHETGEIHHFNYDYSSSEAAIVDFTVKYKSGYPKFKAEGKKLYVTLSVEVPKICQQMIRDAGFTEVHDMLTDFKNYNTGHKIFVLSKQF